MRMYQPTISLICIVAFALLIAPKIWAGNGGELTLAGGVAVPHGVLRSIRASEGGRGVSVFGAFDQFVDPVFSLGMRVSYSGFKNTSYTELSCRLAANTRPADKFGPFFHSIIGVHSTETGRSSTSIGYGVGLGLRIPLGKTRQQRFLVESTYYITKDARMFALRFGFAFGLLESIRHEEF